MPKEAEQPLAAGYEILKNQSGPYLARLQDARKDLVEVYDALKQPDKAAKFRAELAAQK